VNCSDATNDSDGSRPIDHEKCWLTSKECVRLTVLESGNLPDGRSPNVPSRRTVVL
jgi:hypothetical protein